MIQSSSLRRAMIVSLVLHAAGALMAWLVAPVHTGRIELVDIELAPPRPPVEALPPEVARPPRPDVDHRDEAQAEAASLPPSEPGASEPGAAAEATLDAGVDAAVDARPDAKPDAKPDARPDANIDAAIDAAPDAAIDAAPDAMLVAGSDLDAAPSDAGVTAADANEPLQLAAADPGDAGVGGTASDAGDDAPKLAAAGTLRTTAIDAGGDALKVAAAEGSAPKIAAAAGSGSASSTEVAADAGPREARDVGGLVASSTGSGSASESSARTADTRLDTAALAAALAAAVPGDADVPAVDGAPTTAGTAANLLSYFPDGHVLTALIRFDRLRGTEWAAQTERLLRPMPDYQLLFGARDADITARLETLVISTPRPRDAAATTLVARTRLSRAALRDLLGASSPVTWSAARGGLLGHRTGKRFQGDRRVFLSPFQGWFLLAQPDDLAGLTAAARGKLDTIEATGALPPWLAGIRKIESETGEPRGPALVVTVALGGKRFDLADSDLGLGIQTIPLPDRISLAMELVPQGWLIRGNLRFATDADADELVTSVSRFQQRIAGSRTIQLVIGKPIARVVANLAFARAGPRVSYATSISIADARAILAAAAQHIDQYFGQSFRQSSGPPGRTP